MCMLESPRLRILLGSVSPTGEVGGGWEGGYCSLEP